jgi:hypothetical protein
VLKGGVLNKDFEKMWKEVGMGKLRNYPSN